MASDEILKGKVRDERISGSFGAGDVTTAGSDPIGEDIQ